MKTPCILIVSLWASLGLTTIAETSPPASDFDLSHWKLTLPVSTSGTTDGNPMEISAAQLSAGYTSELYFYRSPNGEMVLWCPVSGAKTKNSTYPRTELRELIDPADDKVCWTAAGTHVLEARCRVSEVPTSQKVIIGQIHSYSGRAKPLIKLQFMKGRIEALIKEGPESGKDLKLTFADVGLDNEFDFQIRLQDGVLSGAVNGTAQIVNIYESDPAWANQTFYFKAGAYGQDHEGPASEGSRVCFSKLLTSHSPSSPPKRPSVPESD